MPKRFFLVALFFSLLFSPFQIASAQTPLVDYPAYGLPYPEADTKDTVNPSNGTMVKITGYNDLLTQLSTPGSDANWAVSALLDAEHAVLPKKQSMKPYLTTAWLWFENGASSWPDPYEINCNDNRPGFVSRVTDNCSSTNFQIAGYQVANHEFEFVKTYELFYTPDQIQSVMKAVIDNSIHARKEGWSYAKQKDSLSSGLVKTYLSNYFANGLQASAINASLSDISPNSNLYDAQHRGQFFTLLLGKDPKFVIALNSSAVNDGFIAGLKRIVDPANPRCLYGYICAPQRQLLANMVKALTLFEAQHPIGDLCPNPIEPDKGSIDTQSMVDKIRQSCIENGQSGRVSIRNTVLNNSNCLLNIQPALQSLAVITMTKSAQVNEFLQCVGFVQGAVAQSTGSLLKCNNASCGNAVDYSRNIPQGYRYIDKYNGAIRMKEGDIPIWDYMKHPNPSHRNPYGHIAIACQVNYETNGTVNSFRICEGNVDALGTVSNTRVIPYDMITFIGWLTKL